MKEIKTVFKVTKDRKEETYAVSGYGQEAASAICQKFPITRIVLLGFMIDGQYVLANFEE